MTDKELKNRLKKIGIIFLIVCVFIVILALKVFASSKAELSITSDSQYGNDLRLLGIEKEEFKKYLSIFANLVDKDEKEDILILDCTTRFIDEMSSVYQDENEVPKYEYDIVNDVAKELKGAYISKDINYENKYSYDLENENYIRNGKLENRPVCSEIKEIKLNGDKIEVTYKIENSNKEIKAVVMKNSEYEYSKYYLVSIKD